MSTQLAALRRPEFGRLYGITHDVATRRPIIRTNRVLKIGIGAPKGRAIMVFLVNGRWHIRHGIFEKNGTASKLVMKTVFQGGAFVDGVETPNTREAAEKWHNANKHKAAISNRPMKVPYFTFTRRVTTEEGGKVSVIMEPDFDAIEAHGDLPQRVSVVVTTDNPIDQEYAWYSASEKKCHGDGLLAERVISLGSAVDENWQEAKAAGQKMFLYTGGCYESGCPHARTDCKPHTTMNVQLSSSLRLGATAYFTTTGGVSAGNLGSSFSQIKETIAGLGCSVAYAPMDLVLNHFPANFEGKGITLQPYVTLELRSSGVQKLRTLLNDTSWTPTKLTDSPVAEVRQITAADMELENDPVGARTFDVEASDPDFDDDDDPTPIPVAATATQLRQQEVARKLQEAREKTPAMIATAAASVAAGELPTVARVPWTSQAGMTSLFHTVKERVGDEAFQRLQTKYDVMMGTLAWDDPKAYAFYLELKATKGDEEPF